jgi:hypothetical protein
MGRKMLTFLIPVFLLACSLTPWNSEEFEGSGVPGSESRSLEPFSRIDVTGEADVSVSFGSTQSVIVEADDNLLDQVKTSVRGDTLVIGHPFGRDLQPRYGIRVTVVMNELDGFEISGSGNIDIAQLDSEAVDFSIPGSGIIRADGAADRLTIDLGGSGDILCGELEARAAGVTIGGSGNATVYVTESLDAEISGSGNIFYAGDPVSVDQSVSGSGNISAIP